MAEQPFEELVARLEEHARKLEEGNIPLEEAMTTYEEGAALVQQLRKLLDDAELRVQRLQGDLEEGANFREDVEPYDESAATDDTG
ncbi:MAG: exodeoxyribonuclease VII small subunit [Chloroflexi bacterium]|nr:exodeoxyribonuclease VII small subunit [Chloroflexota bacterium]